MIGTDPLKCTEPEAPAQITVSTHRPKTSWHPHSDSGVTHQRDTEYEAFAQAVQVLLTELTSTGIHEDGKPIVNAAIMVGYLCDMINGYPAQIRLAVLRGIGKGLGLEITENGDTLNIAMVSRYAPLTKQPQTQSGLVLPKTNLPTLDELRGKE